MKRRMLSILLALAMVFTMLPSETMKAQADDTEMPEIGLGDEMSAEGTTFTIEDGVMTFTGSGEMERPMDYDKESVTEIIIEEGITSIANFSFWDCTNLKKVTIPDSVTVIGMDAFHGTALESVTIPASVTLLDDSCFYQCYELKTVTFLGSAPQIVSNAFMEVDAVVYYPGDDASWTTNVRWHYNGSLVWKVIPGTENTPVANILCEPVTIVEGTRDSSYISSDGSWGYSYWNANILPEMTIEMKDGTSFTGTLSEIESYYGETFHFSDETGNTVVYDWEQGEHTLYGEFMGKEFEVPVFLVDSGVESIEFEPYEQIEEKDGSFQTDQQGERYFSYDLPPYDLKMTITYKDGRVEKGIYGDLLKQNGFRMMDGNYQLKHHLVPGENTIPVLYAGRRVDLTITIVSTPVKDIAYGGYVLSVEYGKYAHLVVDDYGETIDDLQYHYEYDDEAIRKLLGDVNLTIIMKDGTSFRGTIAEIEEHFGESVDLEFELPEDGIISNVLNVDIRFMHYTEKSVTLIFDRPQISFFPYSVNRNYEADLVTKTAQDAEGNTVEYQAYPITDEMKIVVGRDRTYEGTAEEIQQQSGYEILVLDSQDPTCPYYQEDWMEQNHAAAYLVMGGKLHSINVDIQSMFREISIYFNRVREQDGEKVSGINAAGETVEYRVYDLPSLVSTIVFRMADTGRYVDMSWEEAVEAYGEPVIQLEQNADTHLMPGSNEINYTWMGYRGTDYLNIQAQQTESIEVNDREIVEGTTGCTWSSKPWLGEEDVYDYEVFPEGQQMKVNLVNGAVLTANKLSDFYRFGPTIPRFNATGKNWSAGSYTVTGTYLDGTFSYTITIKETEIESVSLEVLSPVYETANSLYDLDILATVTMKDGSVKTGTMKEMEEEFGCKFMIVMRETPWKIGEHTAYVRFQTVPCDLTVEILPTPVTEFALILTADAETYETAAVSDKKVKSLAEGTEVIAVAFENGWYELEDGSFLNANYAYDKASEDPKAEDKIGQGTATKKVTIYAQPYEGAESCGTIGVGSVKNLYAQSGNWYQIYSNSKYVWVRADGFNFTSSTIPGKLTTGIITADTLMYYGPGCEFETCGTVTEGRTVNVYERKTFGEETWYKIYSGGKYVWVDGNYLYDKATPEPTSEDKIGVGTATVKVTIYSAPDAGSTALGTVAAGKERNLYAQSGNWYQIYSGGAYVWVRCDSFDYTKANTNSSYATAVFTEKTATYYGHGYDYAPAAVISAGTKVNVYAQWENWYLVYKTGKYLWIDGKYLKDFALK